MSEKSKKDKKDLTVSQVDRQNILNNPYALQEIEKATRIKGIPFEGKTVVLKEQVSAFFEVTPRTIDNYIEKFGEELRQNGYEVLRGNRLKSLKLEISMQGVNETDLVTKTTVLGSCQLFAARTGPVFVELFLCLFCRMTRAVKQKSRA